MTEQPDETSGITVIDHLVIKDVASGELVVNKANNIYKKEEECGHFNPSATPNP